MLDASRHPDCLKSYFIQIQMMVSNGPSMPDIERFNLLTGLLFLFHKRISFTAAFGGEFNGIMPPAQRINR